MPTAPFACIAIRKFFRVLPDPRRRRKRIRHPLLNLVVIALCATIAGADDADEMIAFARQQRDWFAKFLDLSAGLPSHDTLERVLAALDPVAFQQCLLAWVQALHEVTAGQVIAIDGKVAREAMARAGEKGPLCLVSAWATANQMVLGQVAAAPGSNELGALPRLLELLDLHGALVTLDALGCQTDIVAQIVERGANYVISVKGNQPKLETAVIDAFEQAATAATPLATVSRTRKRYGKTETRTVAVLAVPEDFPGRDQWKGLRSLVMAVRESPDKEGQYHTGVRYFISSRPPQVHKLADAVRSHWKVENQLAWVMDVSFGEDRSRARAKNAQANLGMLRRTALSLIKNTPDLQGGIKKRRKQAGWNTAVLEQILFGGKSVKV